MRNAETSVAISAVIIVRDAEATLAVCLQSLAFLPEVIVYDNGSVDRTQAIARSFPNVCLHSGLFHGFGPSKNHAAGLARHSWILSIDSDESVSQDLGQSLLAADLSDPSIVYSVWRHNYMLGRRVRHSGWGQDWLPRLYHRGSARLSDAAVHEKLTWDAGMTVRRLPGTLRHDAVRDIGDLLVKINRYSEIRRKTRPITHPPALIMLRAWWAFVRTYLLKRGWLDGWRGVIIAWADADGVFYKYMMSYADTALRREHGEKGPQPHRHPKSSGK